MKMGQQQTGAISKKETLLEEADHRISESVGEVYNLAVRLHSIADRIVGVQPQDAGKQTGKVDAPPCSTLTQMDRTAQQLLGARDHLQDAVERLERL
jgi:hypothetical protein